MTRTKSEKATTERARRFELSSQNRSPLYHQIYLILRSRIFDGEYGPGEYLPGERDLEAMFKVSRITAVRALNELAAAGLVVRERGRGTRVQFIGSGTVVRGPAGVGDTAAAVKGGLPGGQLLTEAVLDSRHSSGKAEVTVHDFDYITPGPAIAAALRLTKSQVVQYATRVWRFEGLPFNYVITFVPQDIGKNWSRRDLESTPLRDLLARSGVVVSLVQEQVTATLADSLLSQRLDVAIGSPILKIRRTTFDKEGRPVEHLTGFYPPDRYHYEVSLPYGSGGRFG